MLAVFGGLGSALVVGATLSIVAGRKWWGTTFVTVLLALAGIVGFLGFAITSIGRQELSDC